MNIFWIFRNDLLITFIFSFNYTLTNTLTIHTTVGKQFSASIFKLKSYRGWLLVIELSELLSGELARFVLADTSLALRY